MAELGCNGSGPSAEPCCCLPVTSSTTLYFAGLCIPPGHATVYFLGSRTFVRSVCVCFVEVEGCVTRKFCHYGLCIC